jgi:ABC-type bacteriocin/lantibiotic exporter with double-glycine peptidase domain
MRTRPEISFRCGPLALHRIKLGVDPQNPGTDLVHAAASTQRGFSLSQVAELSHKLGLDFQMAYREKGVEFVVPSVVHLKLDHYAALVRQEGDRYLLQDPTFGNNTWATREALEAETSGYFLIPRGELARGWRAVHAQEGETVWGKGNVGDG